MSSGAAPRTTLDLRVRVWGMGANDQPFFQNANAQNVSATGACVYGLEQQLKVGDVIGIQYETKKARCKVIWVTDAGGLKKITVGIHLVADQECPWLSQVSPESVSTSTIPRHDNRRRCSRHRISFPLELRDERVNTPMRMNATDISGNGCYVETVMPLQVGITLKADFWIDQEHVLTSATVRTRDPGVGMGIEFTGMTDDTKKRFQTFLNKIDPSNLAQAQNTSE